MPRKVNRSGLLTPCAQARTCPLHPCSPTGRAWPASRRGAEGLTFLQELVEWVGPTDDEIEAKPASTWTQPPQRAARIRRLRTPGKRSRAAAHEAICRVSEASTVITVGPTSGRLLERVAQPVGYGLAVSVALATFGEKSRFRQGPQPAWISRTRPSRSRTPQMDRRVGVWGADPRRVSKFVDSRAETLESLGCLTVFVYLDGKPSAALDRAIAREADPGWLDWLIATLRDADGPPVLDRPVFGALSGASPGVSDPPVVQAWEAVDAPGHPRRGRALPRGRSDRRQGGTP